MSTESDAKLHDEAIAYAKAHKESIAKRLTDLEVYPRDEIPVSVFMAGSPGAGKTESSQRLIDRFTSASNSILRIDSDDLRKELPGYTGVNSSLFQAATSIIADRMQDLALKQRQSYVFDGTLTNLVRSRENIAINLKKSREVYVLYVYQDPLQAWAFVKAREKKDGRVIPKDVFIHQYFCARQNVTKLKQEFGNQIHVDLIVKNNDGTDFSYRENIDVIDSHIPERYTQDTLEGLIFD